MKINNLTCYNTLQLHKLICRSITECIQSGEERSTKHLYVTIRSSRKICFERWSGRATLNGHRMLLRIPNKSSLEKEDCITFAKLVMHEYDHIIGYHHDVIGRYLDSVSYDISWVTDEYRITVKEPVVKEKSDVKEVRYQKVVKMLQIKHRQLKRLQSAVKKYERKKKYYEKILKDNNNCGEFV